MLYFIVWILFAIMAASFAADQGRSWTGFFLLSVLLSPIAALLVLAVIGRSIQKEIEIEDLKEKMRNNREFKLSDDQEAFVKGFMKRNEENTKNWESS